MPSKLHTARFSEFLTRALELRGSNPDLQVLDDVLPVMVLNDLDMPEQARYRGELLCGGKDLESSTAAGVQAQVYLANDLSSNTLVVLEHVTLLSTVASDTYRIGITQTNAPAPPANLGFAVDTRSWVGPGFATPRASRARMAGTANANALTITDVAGMVLVQNARADLDTPVILRPGFAFVVAGSGTVVASLYAHFRWRERDVVEGDRESI